MSYRFYLFKPRPDVAPLDSAHAHFERSFTGMEPELPLAAKERRNQRMAAAITAYNPALKIAPFHASPVERDRRPGSRAIGLVEPDGRSGIEIGLFDAFATLTIPYWHTDQQADGVLAEAWTYLKLLQHEAVYVTYDPQLDHIIDLAGDDDAVAEAYQRAVQRLQQLVSSSAARSRAC